MVTIAPHNLVTWRGTLGSREMWQFSLHFPDAIGVQNSALAANQLHDAWAPGINSFTAGYCSLTEVRISQIDANGKLAGDPALSTVPAKRGSDTSGFHPYQVALCVSLRSNKVSGKGSHGRFYLPAPTLIVNAEGVTDAGVMGPVRTKVGDFLRRVSAIMGGSGGPAYPILVSRGSTDVQTVTRFAVGDALDTMRSRRGGIPEVRAYAAIGS